jgi:hypothetical protein
LAYTAEKSLKLLETEMRELARNNNIGFVKAFEELEALEEQKCEMR